MNTRRNFLRNSALGVAAMTMAAPRAMAKVVQTEATANKEVFQPVRVSMLSYSFRGLMNAGMMDIFHFFETCKYRYGLDAADLWNGMITSTEDAFVDKVYSALEDRQLCVPNIAVDGGQILMRTDDASPQDRNEMQNRYLQIAKRWGVGFVRFDAGPSMSGDRKPKDGWTNKEFDYLVKRYKEIAAFAYDNGFKAGAENHFGPATCWENMEKLIKAVDHPGFAICQHFGGWNGEYEDNLAAEKDAAKYIAHTHIPWDCCEDPNLAKRLSTLRDANYAGYYSIEQHSAQNEYNLVEVQLAKVKAVITSWNRGRDGELYPTGRQDPNRRFPW